VLIQAIFDESDGTYGYRRIHAALVRQGDGCGPELVRDLMRELQMVPCQPRPWRPTTTRAGEGGEGIPDLVGRKFTAEAPGRKLVGDITYLPTWQGFSYLATVIDCCTKECIGYAIADHMRAELVIDALRMAARNYDLEPGAIFHSDRGSQYLSQDFAEAAAQLDIRQSAGRVGSCFDNALAESFNSALKVERVNRTVYPTREHARRDVVRYIELNAGQPSSVAGLGGLGQRPDTEVFAAGDVLAGEVVLVELLERQPQRVEVKLPARRRVRRDDGDTGDELHLHGPNPPWRSRTVPGETARSGGRASRPR
jgi:transposase InsO family protein